MQVEMNSINPAARGSSVSLLPETHLSHVSSNSNPYPGEPVTLFTLVRASQEAEETQLRLSIPNGLRFIDALLPEQLRATPLAILVEDYEQSLVWDFKDSLKPGQVYQVETHLVVEPTGRDRYFLSRAQLSRGKRLDEETLALNVRAKGRYLKYLPEIYAEDDLMGRFLMLFESFWAPVESQVRDIAFTFDPMLTPQAFLPWLGSWLGMAWPPSSTLLTTERMRQLVKSAVFLNRARGTRDSLQLYLELYTGGKVRIVEHRANDFRLGAAAELGPNIALGSGNRPHTFTVYLKLPEDYGAMDDPLALEKIRQEVVMIIDEQKPAHTQYKLILEDN